MFRSFALITAGLLASACPGTASAGTSAGDDRPRPEADTVRLDGKGDADIQDARWGGGGYRGGWGGGYRGGWGGGYRGWGGYGGYGGYRGYGYGYGYRPAFYFGFGRGYGGYGYGGYGYGSGYGGYYGGGYGGYYPASYGSYGGYYASPVVYSSAYANPCVCSAGVTTVPAQASYQYQVPATAQPPVTTVPAPQPMPPAPAPGNVGTFQYNGGPRVMIPIPRELVPAAAPGKMQRDGRLVSLTPAAPVPHYRAYGEKPEASEPVRAREPASDLLRVSLPASEPIDSFDSFTGGTMSFTQARR